MLSGIGRVAACAALMLAGTGSETMAEGIERFRLEEGSPYRNQFLEAVRVPAGTEQLMLSGMTPPVIDKTVPDTEVAAYGDTETQTRNILRDIKAILEKRGYAMKDVVKMQAFLVGDPKTGKADFAGFSKAYLEVFGTAQTPEIPVRTRTQVVGLVWPGWLVEIEVVAAKVR